MSSAAYPNALLSWTQRVNGETVWAADPNALAAEVDAIEQVIGVNPQNEPSALQGGTSQYSTLSQRVSESMLGQGHPYVQLGQVSSDVWHSTQTAALGHLGMNTLLYGWSNMTAGGSIVIQDQGIYLINADVVWPYLTGGWVTHVLMFNGNQMRRSIFNYDQFPTSGSNTYGERFINQNGYTETTFVGHVNAGTVVSIFVGNMSNQNPVSIVGSSLSAYFLRP